MIRTVLAIDQAATSGWALFVGGALQASGLARTAAGRAEVVALFMVHADRTSWVVLEDHSKISMAAGGKYDPQKRTHTRKDGKKVPRRTTATLLGMGAAAGRWHEQLDVHGFPQARRAKVEPKVWRRVLGLGVGVPAAVAKQQAILVAHQRFNRLVTDDEAEAVAIGLWALSAPKIGRAA